MNSQYPSLVFPDTDIFNDRQFPLLLFGSMLYYLQPVEADAGEEVENDHDSFIKRGLCQALTPAPLGKHRDRFLHLVNDIATRTDDYAAQLSALTVTTLGESRQPDTDEKRHQIVSSLIGDSQAVSADEEELDETRWQARLVLAIGEILKRAEAELQQEMQVLDGQELDMFRSLQGDGNEDEDPFAALEQMSADRDHSRPREQKVRFQAWLTLMSCAPLPRILFWLASSPDAADQIFNAYEKTSVRPIRPVLDIPLPDHIEASPVFVAEQIDAFRQDSSEIMDQLLSDLDTIRRSPGVGSGETDDLLPGRHDALARWAELLDGHFPAGSHGRASLVFYLLPSCDIFSMLNLDSEEPDQAEHAVVGVLKRG